MSKYKKIKLFSYYGGKYYLLDDILTEMIRIIEKYNIKCVVDVFGGSGSVILSLPLEYKVFRVYNDIDRRLTTVLKVLMDNEKREKIINSLEFAIRSRDLFNEFNNSDWDNLTDEEIAFRFLYINAYSFRGNMNSYALTINYDNNRDNMNILINNIKNNFKYIRELNNIENLDFREIIKKYGRETTLFYLDPPYLKGSEKYKYKLTEKDYIDLKELLDYTHSKYILNHSDKDIDIINRIFGSYTFIKQYRNHYNQKKGFRYEGFWLKEGD